MIIISLFLFLIVYFKLQNGQFNKQKLQSLVKVYHLIGWDNTYTSVIKLIQKNGISLDFK